MEIPTTAKNAFGDYDGPTSASLNDSSFNMTISVNSSSYNMSTLPKSSFGRLPPSQLRILTMYSPLFCFGFIGIILNLVAVLAACKLTRKKKNSSDIFLISLLISDLCASILAFSFPLGKVFKPRVFPSSLFMEIICRIWYSKFLQRFSAEMSLLICVLLTLDRYGKIVFPIMHLKWMSKKKACVGVGVVFGCNFIVKLITVVIPTSVNNGICKDNPANRIVSRLTYCIFDLVFGILIPLILFIFCYGHMFVVIHKRHLRVHPNSCENIRVGKMENMAATSIQPFTITEMHHNIGKSPPGDVQALTNAAAERHCTRNSEQSPGPSNNTLQVFDVTNLKLPNNVAFKGKSQKTKKNQATKTKFAQAERNVFITAGLVYVSFLICNLPIRIYLLLGLSGVFEEDYKSPLFLLMSSLVILNFCLHPVIYAFALKRLRDHIICKKCRVF